MSARLPSKKELRVLASDGRKLIELLDDSPFPTIAPARSRKFRRGLWKLIRILDVMGK